MTSGGEYKNNKYNDTKFVELRVSRRIKIDD